jgi:hypothetical protein
MRTAYGGQWKHGPQALKVWRNALSRYEMDRLEWAAGESMNLYSNHPPTLPQFLAILRPTPKPASTYLPAPTMTRTQAVGNKTLLSVLKASCGVDAKCLTNLVALKNALVEEFLSDHEDRPTKAFVADIHQQLTELADNHDREAKARETFEARRKFCRQRGFPDPALEQ